MAEKFDPYHKWLGIPPKDQPPSHYRLLGLEEFESDVEVIEAAANRQMAYLQEVAVGAQIAHSQKLLNEIAAARVCLLDSEARAQYDVELERRHPRPRKRRVLKGMSPSPSAPPEHATAQPIAEPAQFPARQSGKAARSLRRHRHRNSPLPWVLAGVLGLAVVIAGAMYLSQGGEEPTQQTGGNQARKSSDNYVPQRPGQTRNRETIVIDAEQAAKTGAWTSRAPGRGSYSGDGVHVVQPGEFGQMVFFWPAGAPSGRFELQLSYFPLQQQSSKVPVRIKSLDGTTNTTVNQSVSPPIDGRYCSLGTFHFDGRSEILISNEGVDGPVVVDAVRLVPVD